MREWAQEVAMPPSGNGRHNHRGLVSLPKGGRGNSVCPRCHTGLVATTQISRTKDYERWLSTTGAQLRAKFGTFDTPVTLYLWIMGGRGFIETRDLDNAMKCLGDALTTGGVLTQDDVRQLKSVRLHYFSREEHLAHLGGGLKKHLDALEARAFVYLTPAHGTDPWAV